jgi:AraC-like DNA-binding protein
MNLALNNNQNSSYFAPGVVIAYGTAIDTKPHQHSLWQLCLPSKTSTLNGEVLLTGKIIEPNEPHQLSMPEGWIILAEPESKLGNTMRELSIQILTKASPPLPVMIPTDNVSISALVTKLDHYIPLVESLKNNPYQCQSKHLLKLLARLDSCLNGNCLKPDQWRAKDVANWLAISESQFLYLVTKELGVSWRPYLLWRRLICAIQAIKTGVNLTEAAYLSGFSDSAHLCRTIKRTFGMTSKQLLSCFR